MTAALVALVALLGSLAGASAQGTPSADLSLASQTAWVRDGQPFVVRVDVDRVRQPEELTLALTVHRAVTSRSQFVRTLDGELLGRAVEGIAVPFEELRFDAAGAVPITVALPELRPGVYPVSVVARDADDDAVASLFTHLIRVPDGPATVPLSVAWVQDYAADPALQPDGTVALPDEVLDELRVVAGQLARGVPMTVRPSPETIEALETIDDGRTVGALAALLERHQVLSQPYVDLALGPLAARGRSRDIAMQRVAGDAVLDELGIATDPRSWSLTGPVTEDALGALVSLGVDQIVVDDAALEPLDPRLVGGITLARPFRLDAPGRTVDSVAVDAGLAAHFATDDDVLGAHQLLADLAVLYFDSPGVARGVVIRPPDRWTPTEAFLGTAIGGLASSPLLAPTTLDGLFAAVEPLTAGDEPVVRPIAPATGEPTLGFALGDLDRARAAIDGFRTFTAAPGAASLPGMDRLLLVAMSADLTREQRQRYLGAVTDSVSGAAAKVRVLGDRTYRLTAREGTVPLTLVNDNDFDVIVDVELSSDKLAFTDADDSEALGSHRIDDVVVEAGGTVTRAVPVKARTSGTSSLRVAMRSPDGAIVLASTTITITSTFASWVGIVLSIGAASFLLLWWASHFRTVRRARKLVPPE